MCTLRFAERTAVVCDVALPSVRASLDADPALAVGYEPKPGDGTEVSLHDGDPAAFEARVRAGIATAAR